MRDVTIEEIKQIFGDETFLKGLEYFKDERVIVKMKKGNKLIGTVLGSAPSPYKVSVKISDIIRSRCTCPVGEMCKHGVALILQWINKRDSFLDVDNLLSSLEEKDKSELIRIIDAMIEEEPLLASKLVLFRDLDKKKVNLNAISRSINNILRGFLDYYEVPSVVNDLKEVKRIGDKLAEEGNFKEAIDVYLLLIKKGVDAFESGVDDSDGILGDFIIECVEDFKKNAIKLEEGQKRALISKVIDIIEVEDYGLDTDEMLFSIATKENIAIIEEILLKKIPSEGENFHVEYERRRILDLLTSLYEHLGLHEDVLRVMRRAGLKNKDDYLRFAKVLMIEGRNKEAFDYVRKGLKLGKEMNYDLNELYFNLLDQLLKEEGEMKIEEEEAIDTAINLLSYHFNSQTYDLVKRVFEKIGKYEELISAIKTKCRESIAVSVLLHDRRVDDAIEYAISSTTLDPIMIIEVAKAAKEKGRKEDAVKLTLKALKQGIVSANELVVELVRLLVESLDEKGLREAIGYIRSASMAKVFVDALLERSQELAVRMLENFIADMKKEEIEGYVRRLRREYALEICHSWVSKFINRSHVYYDDAIDILKVMREIAGEEEWRRYMKEFIDANKGKRKLMEKIRKAGLT